MAFGKRGPVVQLGRKKKVPARGGERKELVPFKERGYLPVDQLKKEEE